jgi:ABC-type phosphate transport system ATPase subunit
LSEIFPVHIDLKQDASSPLLRKVALHQPATTVKKKKKKDWLELNGMQQLLGCTAHVYLLAENMIIINENGEALDPSKEVGIEVKSEKTKYMKVYPKVSGLSR